MAASIQTTTTAAATSTEPPTTTTTVPVATLYAEMDKEVQRACGTAMDARKPPAARFNARWAGISTEAKLQAAAQQCVNARTAAATTLPPPTTAPPTTAPPVASTYYANCTEARNAGVTPIYAGQPGYSSHLDRDGDGIACE